MLRGSLTRLPTSTGLYLPPSRKQSCMDLNSASKLPSRLLTKTKSNQSLVYVSSAGPKPSNDHAKISNTKLRQQHRPASPQTKTLLRSDSNSSLQLLNKKKSLPQIASSVCSDDDSKSCLTRSSSNGSSSTTKSRRNRKLKKQKTKTATVSTQTANSDEFDTAVLKDELEREKSSARALLGQKEGTNLL